ncbi:MAG: hypothetical protein ACPGOV_15155 [Magnetovibrionaceae bacterium]
MITTLLAAMGAIALVSLIAAPRARTPEGFFLGVDEKGRAPGLWTLVLSQVTTWIFARSLMNAAILGFYFGIAGVLAYAAYYLSFVTGWIIVDRIRFRLGHESIQSFLKDQFGRSGVFAFNMVIGVRLLSEVFANLLVIGIIFGVAGTTSYTLSIVAVACVTLLYSMMGGLRASLKTDVFQAGLLIAALIVLLVSLFGTGIVSVPEIMASSPDIAGPGWILLAVAALQVWSYPMHDPVMMDRGFLADRQTTRKSFLHAAWISILCILAFGLLGLQAGLSKAEGEAMVDVLTRLLGDPLMVVFNVALVISAVSTLDSTFSSAARLSIVHMGLAETTTNNGRVSMALFMLGGLAFLFTGSKDLFAAVAVSGTASMFLAPVIFFCVLGNQRIDAWALWVAFLAALLAAALYMLEAGGHITVMSEFFSLGHKYEKLLVLCLLALGIGCSAFAISSTVNATRQKVV